MGSASLVRSTKLTNYWRKWKIKGIQHTVVSYGSVIDGLAKINRLNEAYMLFEEAKSKAIDFNVVVYSSVIDGFGKVGRIDEAYLILEELMHKGLTPKFESLTRKA